jgi:hypothetical protein
VRAVLAAGPDAVLSHHSAAALWRIRPTSRTRIEITAPRTLHSRRHLLPHCAVLDAEEITTHEGIPVTVTARTIRDIAGALNLRQLNPDRARHTTEAPPTSRPSSSPPAVQPEASSRPSSSPSSTLTTYRCQ